CRRRGGSRADCGACGSGTSPRPECRDDGKHQCPHDEQAEHEDGDGARDVGAARNRKEQAEKDDCREDANQQPREASSAPPIEEPPQQARSLFWPAHTSGCTSASERITATPSGGFTSAGPVATPRAVPSPRR